jgi:hypothetical protein
MMLFIVLLLLIATAIAVFSGLKPPKAQLWWSVVLVCLAVFLCCAATLFHQG